MHVVLKLNDDVVAGWLNEDVVRRWGKLFPPCGKNRQPLEVSEAWVKLQLKNGDVGCGNSQQHLRYGVRHQTRRHQPPRESSRRQKTEQPERLPKLTSIS